MVFLFQQLLTSLPMCNMISMLHVSWCWLVQSFVFGLYVVFSPIKCDFFLSKFCVIVLVAINFVDLHVFILILVQLPRLYNVYKQMGIVTNFQNILDNVFIPLFEVTIDPSSHPQLHVFLKQVSSSVCMSLRKSSAELWVDNDSIFIPSMLTIYSWMLSLFLCLLF